jgi:TolB protein
MPVSPIIYHVDYTMRDECGANYMPTERACQIVVQQPALHSHRHCHLAIAPNTRRPLFLKNCSSQSLVAHPLPAGLKASVTKPTAVGWKLSSINLTSTLFLKNVLWLTLVLLLVGCASAAATATPTPALGPLPTMPVEPIARPAGSAPTVAAQGPALPGRLLFVQGGNLWVWEGDASRQLTSSGDAFQPAWSPDGQRIAYIQRVTSFSDLLVMPFETSEPLRLTRDGPDSSVYSYERIYASMWAFYPAWSPDGTMIAFASQAGPPSGAPAAEFRVSLFTTSAGAGGERTQLYADAGGHVGRLAYAPDGQSIAFAFGPAGEDEPRIYRYTVADGSAAPIVGAPAQSYDPAWTPDGRWLAFAARANGHTDVFALRSSGGPTIQLTSVGTARAPAFSPDGKQLAFLAITPGDNSFDLWVLDLAVGADGALTPGQPRQITQGMALDADSGVAWAR